MSVFMNRYRQELGDYFRPVNENKSALNNFMMLLEAVQLSGCKVFCLLFSYHFYSKNKY